MKSRGQSPDSAASLDDPGDSTAQRYRFQHCFAAITASGLLDDTADLCEVFCEHHEDVLCKHNDGKFSGYQVKTRRGDQPVWKTGEKDFVKSCARFAQLEAKFPGWFRGYKFLTNHPLHAADAATSAASGRSADHTTRSVP